MGHVYVWNGGNGTLSVAADWTDATTGSIALAAPGAADSATVVGSASGAVLAAGTLDVAALLIGGGVALTGAVAAGTLTDAGTLSLEGGATLTAGNASLSGTLDVDALSAAAIGTGARAGAGTLAIGAGAMLSGSGAINVDSGNIALAGTLAAAGGALAVFGSITGAGTLAIGAGATLFAAGAAGSGLTAAFTGAGATLELFGAAATFSATIEGFAAGDAIDIASDSIETATWAGGVLTLTDSAGTTLALALPDQPGTSYDAASFLVLPDGLGGTEIVLAPAGTTQASGNLAFTVPAGASVLLTGSGTTVSQVVAAGMLGIAEHVGTNSISVTGTLDVAGTGGTLTAPAATVTGGLLAATGAHAYVQVHGSLQLAAGTFAASGGGWANATSITLAGGVLALDPASSMTVGAATAEVGRLAVPSGSTIAGWGRILAPVDDEGAIAAAGGALVLAGPASGAGTVEIGAGATLVAFGTLALPVAFDAGATLALLGGPGLVTGTLSGFAAGDGLDVVGTAIGSAAWANGTLTLSEGGAVVSTLAVAGADTGLVWQAQPDGAGGTLVSLAGNAGAPLAPVPCFAAGTRIATPDGEVPVEVLRPGDAVLTPDGPRPLRWVGSRACDTRAAPEARPVRIAAGALARLLGAALPRRDLLLSPQHALLLRGALVPAVALVGLRKITRQMTDFVIYFHLGLDVHATVLAEGTPAETYLPLDAAARFDAEWGERPLPAAPCAPRLEGGAALAALQRKVSRAPRPAVPAGPLRGHLERVIDLGGAIRLEGWAVDAAAPERPVSLLVSRGGRRLGVAVANHWRPDLDRAGLAGGCCAFTLDLPGPAAGLLVSRRRDGAVLPALHGAGAQRPA